MTSVLNPFNDPFQKMVGNVVPKMGNMEIPDFPKVDLPEYNTAMGMGFRLVTLPLLLPTPMGVLAAAQTLLAVTWMASLAYDIYLHEEVIDKYAHQLYEGALGGPLGPWLE